jgi:hypothetical protein
MDRLVSAGLLRRNANGARDRAHRPAAVASANATRFGLRISEIDVAASTEADAEPGLLTRRHSVSPESSVTGAWGEFIVRGRDDDVVDVLCLARLMRETLKGELLDVPQQSAPSDPLDRAM